MKLPIRPLFHRPLLFSTLLALAATAWAQKPTPLERGKVLMQGIVACGNCHTAFTDKGPDFSRGLAGGMVFDEPPFKAVASNITPDAETGIGKWTDAQLIKAIREGVRPDGSVIGPPMPIEFYRHLSDSDARAIVAWLRAQPAVANRVAKSTYNTPLPPNYGPPLKTVSAPQAGRTVAYGEYLARIGHCMECHSPRGADGRLNTAALGAGGQSFKGPWGESISRNLTPHPSGLKDWTDAQIIKALREGVDRNGQPYKPPMAFAYYKNVPEADMAALLLYLRSLKPQAFGGKS